MSSVSDSEWKDVQEKTFTKWLNSKLSRGMGISGVKLSDLSNGILLPQLLEVIGNCPFKGYNKGESLSRIQKLENINMALEYIKQSGVKLTNIGATDIVDGNKKLMLGLLWTLILRFVVKDISEGEVTAKQGLLLWCQRKTKGYKNVNIESFGRGWSDGLAFCALIHSHRPDLVEKSIFDTHGSRETLELAFCVASEHLDIPKLLDPEDVDGSLVQDERSIITYVAQYFHKFTELDQVNAARRRIVSFSKNLERLYMLQQTLDMKINAAQVQIQHLVSKWGVEKSFSPLEAEKLLFEDKNLSLDCILEFQKIDSLLTEIQSIRTSIALPPLETKDNLMERLYASMENVVQKEIERRKLLHDVVRKEIQKKKMEYAKLANDLNSGISKLLHSIEIYERQKKLDKMKGLVKEAESFDITLDNLRSLYKELSSHGTGVNEYTLFSPSDIQKYHENAKSKLEKRISTMEKSLSKHFGDRKLDDAMVGEIENTFYHFDKERSNQLSIDTFKASCDALGLGIESERLEEVFMKLAVNDKISIESFRRYVTNEVTDDDSPEKLKQAFRVISKKKDTISEQELIAGLQAAKGPAQFLISKIPKTDKNRLNYNEFVDGVYSSTDLRENPQ